MTPITYNFPPTVYVDKNTRPRQIDHILSEAVEVSTAATETAQDLEIIDLYHSIETYLRQLQKTHGPEYLAMLVNQTIKKNSRRGYYTQEG